MFFTVEPMINAGRYEVKVLEDGWTAVTRDRSLSAQFEHTVGVTEDGVRDLYAVADRVASTALFGLGAPAAMAADRPGKDASDKATDEPDKVSSETPGYLGHRQRLRERFLSGGDGRAGRL